MRALGVENVSSFSSPQGKPVYVLGHACNGEQVPRCLKFYQGFFKDFTEQHLADQVCIPKCRRKS